jgi:RNA recognition motif-containing protein
MITDSTIFVRNLGFTTSVSTVYRHFHQFGHITHIRFATDRKRTGERVFKGYGFVTFADIPSARRALMTFEHTIEGRICQTYWATTRQPGTPFATAEEEVLSFLTNS